MSSFNPKRLKLARERRGMTLVSLGQKISMTARMLSEYENNRKEPPQNTLEAIARVLDFPIAFFFGEDIEELSVQTVSFRSLSKLRAKQIKAALRAAEIAFKLNEWLEKRFELPQVDLPDLGNYGPETAARVLRDAWGLGEQPIRNMVYLLEAKGVKVFSLVEDARELNAFSFWKGGIPFIFLNTIKSAESSRFDAGHELGHLVLHKHGAPNGKEPESQANRFAASFLMSEGSVRAYAPRFPTIENLKERKKVWIVSMSALTRRLKDLGLISEWQYHNLMVQISSQGMRINEPEPAPRETSNLLNMVLKELWTDGITKAHIARDLTISPEEIEGLVFELTSPITQAPKALTRPALKRVK
jgi:Zn-dependent peptidase ImmA (M78 family)/DNA-binding XRE family transcriptional regulator